MILVSLVGNMVQNSVHPGQLHWSRIRSAEALRNLHENPADLFTPFYAVEIGISLIHFISILDMKKYAIDFFTCADLLFKTSA